MSTTIDEYFSSLEDKITIVGAVLGAAIGVVLIAVIVLTYLVVTLWQKVFPNESSKRKNIDNYAYNKPDIETGEELNRRGFSMHRAPQQHQNQQPQSHHPNNPVQDPRNRQPQDRDPYAYVPPSSIPTNNDRNISKDASNDFGDFDNMVFGGDPKPRKSAVRPPPGMQAPPDMRNNRANINAPPPLHNNSNIMYGAEAYTPPQSANRFDDRPYSFNRGGPNY